MKGSNYIDSHVTSNLGVSKCEYLQVSFACSVKTVNLKLLRLFPFSGEDNSLLSGVAIGKSFTMAFAKNICNFFLCVVKFSCISCYSASVFFVLCQPPLCSFLHCANVLLMQKSLCWYVNSCST